MKKNHISILASLAILCFVNIAIASSPDWVWAKGVGGKANEEAKDLCTDAAGNIYVTGFFNSPSITFGSDSLKSAGSGDIFIVKYDPSGNLLWAKRAGGESSDMGNSIATDAAGNVYVTGYYQSAIFVFGKDTLKNAGNTDVFILKYDSSGKEIWAKSIGEDGNDAGQSIHTDASNNVFVSGYFQSSTITFGTNILTNASNKGTSDIFIVKYNAAGNVAWAKSAGGTSFDFGTSITNDAGGNVLLTGYFKSPMLTFGEITLKNTTTDGTVSDIFVAKYDPLGNVLWAKSAGGATDDGSNSISTDASGNVYIAGYFQSTAISFGSITLKNTGSYDVFIAKYDASGNVAWAKNIWGDSYDYATGVCADATGNVFLTGYFQSKSITFGSTTLTNENDGSISNIFIAKFDSLGNVLEARSAGSIGDDESNAICVDASGKPHIAGYFQSHTISFGTSTLTNLGSSDIFVAM